MRSSGLRLLLVLGAGAGAGAGAALAPPVLAASGHPGGARGASCANPFRVSYVRGRVVGDTGKVFASVQRQGNRYTIAWRAVGRTRFCSITVLEARGQRFSSTNPSSKLVYTDYTTNHSNGVKSLIATSRAA